MNEPFNGWLQGIWYYGPLLGLGGVLLLSGLAVMMFFRDFPREITAAPLEIVSPADGVVVAIEDLAETPHYAGPARRISVFMSIFSAHINRVPYGGTVDAVEYAPGRYCNAMKAESSRINESNALRLSTDRGPITVRQISGAVARRIVCPVKPGDSLKKGEKFGMIRFGSRVELYLPPSAIVRAKIGEKVYAGISVIAEFP